MAKRKFSTAERYAVWQHHQKRCWWCKKPLDVVETTIDHVIPESLLDDDDERRRVLEEYGLPDDFNINGFENWLPCHNHCNQSKGSSTFDFVPGLKAVLDRLAREAPRVECTANRINRDATSGKLITKILVALEREEISPEDLDEVIRDHRDTSDGRESIELIQLDNGYWLAKSDVAYEGECRCEREACVGHKSKVNCVFSRHLSSWVVKTGLYWQCYDEEIECPRCSQIHKRGHIGRADICGKPYTDQDRQTD